RGGSRRCSRERGATRVTRCSAGQSEADWKAAPGAAAASHRRSRPTTSEPPIGTCRSCSAATPPSARAHSNDSDIFETSSRGGEPPGGDVGARVVSNPAAPDDFLSGTSGLVFGKRATSRALVADALADARALITGQPWRLRRAGQTGSRRRVLALGVEREGEP